MDKNGLSSFLLGLGVGVGIGMLFAPKSGQETRDLLKNKAGEGTDFHAVDQGYASLTPLQIDLTNRDELPAIVEWLAA